MNYRLSVTERIRRHAVVAPFTVENGLLTPTQKIRRMLVIRANADMLAELHAKFAFIKQGYATGAAMLPPTEHRQCYALHCASGGVGGG